MQRYSLNFSLWQLQKILNTQCYQHVNKFKQKQLTENNARLKGFALLQIKNSAILILKFLIKKQII